MPSIDSFKKSLKDMSEDELNELINTTRNNRTKSKPKKKKKKPKAKTKASKKKLDFENMSPAEAKKLLEKLQGK